MQELPSKAKDEKKKTQESIRVDLRNQSGEYLVSMWIKHPWNTSHIPYSELARTLFPVESLNYKNQWYLTTKLLEMDAFGKEYLSWILDESVSCC